MRHNLKTLKHILIMWLLWCANKCAKLYYTECRNSLFNTHNLPQIFMASSISCCDSYL